MSQKSDTDRPLISVIMPAYNVEKYIGQAIESVLNQTYTNLELVICDDASTDRTCEIVESYADPRIVLCHEESNTGSAHLPRRHAFYACRGEFAVWLDADDYLEERFIEKMYARLAECNADMCLCKIVLVEEDGTGIDQSRPREGFDYSLQITGKETYFRWLAPDWTLGMNGCMAKREAWDYGYKRTYKPGKKSEFAEDENAARFMALWTNKVVFCEANYYYIVRTGSITHTFDRRVFGWRTMAEDLFMWIREDFGKDSKEYEGAALNNYILYRTTMLQFIKSSHTVPKQERRWYRNELKKWHDRMDWKAVREYVGYPRYILLHRNFYVEYLTSLLWFKKRA